MTEPQQEAAAEPVVSPELAIEFHGREIYVKMPRPEQLLVWQRTIGMLTKLQDSAASWTGSEVMAALERCRKIIDSILVNKADIVWLDDQFLEGEIEFKDLLPFITMVVDRFAKAAEENAPNREAKRAVKKTASKAARKKVTS